MASNPLSAFLNIKRKELPLALLMFGYFFMVITVFWILKPVKESVFYGFYGDQEVQLLGMSLLAEQAELFAKVLNMVVAFGAVVAFSALSNSLRRQQLTYVFGAFCIGIILLFRLIGLEGELSVWLFYLFGDLFNTLMVATFFAFLNDSFTPQAAKRTYGPIILGGVCGGAFGTMVVLVNIKSLSNDAWLLIALGGVTLIVALAGLAGAQVAKNPPPDDEEDEPDVAEKSNAAVAGAKLVSRSKYLLAIVTVVAVYEIVSQVIDFQFKSTLRTLADDFKGTLSLVYFWQNIGSMVFQLLATGWILQRIGVRGGLLVMPLMLGALSFGYLIAPIVLMAGLLRAFDNGLNYSLNQSAREALYTVTSREEKYKAKAFIDMFVQRTAKVVAIGLTLLMTEIFEDFSGVRWLSLLAILGIAVWFIAARYAGRDFAERAAKRAAKQEGGKS